MPPAISISCGIQCPPMYGGASHSSAATVRGRRALEARADRVDPVRGLVEQLVGGALVLGHLGEAADVAQHLAERHRVERDHLRVRRDLLRDRAHVVERHGADLAERLGHDQVRLELAQLLRVELVQVLAALRPLAHGGVDLLRGEALRDDRSRQMWQLRRFWRIIALVGDPDDVGAESEREQRFGSGGNEACNAHER